MPVSSTSIRSAAGDFGSPGMVMMSPVSATMKPAPAETLSFRTVRVKPSGAPSFAGSSENEYCVFAMQTGREPKPSASSWRSSFSAGPVKGNGACAVDTLCYGFDFAADVQLVLVGKAEITRFAAEAHDLTRQLQAAFAALGPNLGERDVHTQFPAPALDKLELRLRISREAVYCHDTGQAVYLFYILHVPQQVRQAALEGLEVLSSQLSLCRAAVVFKRANRRHNDDC